MSPSTETNKHSTSSRREFLERGAALGAMATVGAALPIVGARAATPKKGGHLRIGVEGASANLTLDPATIASQYQQTIGYLWGNGLVEVDDKSQMQPELAESWDSKDGAKTWVFKIRKGVQFSNGKELTAADVVYSLNYHKNPDSKSLAKSIVKGIKDIQASDKYEVTITLPAPNVDTPGLLSDYHLLIMPENGKPDAGIGTGPYVIEKFDPAVRATAKRNPNYWKADRAYADSVEVLALNDNTARISALLSGQVDFISRVDPKLVKSLSANPQVNIIEIQRAAHYCFPMLRDTAPFDNKDLCLALKFAIDRKDIVDRILLGHGLVGNDQPIPPFDPMFASDVPQRAYDPEQAKFHFKKSGFSGPVTLSVADAAFPNAVATATLFKEQASKAGIDINVQRVPDDGYWDDIWSKKPFCASYWGGRSPASLFLQAVYVSGSSNNESHWKNPQFDALLAQAQAEPDAGKRKQIFHDMQVLINDDCGTIIPMFAYSLFGTSKKVEGMVKSPVFTGFRIAEQLYFVS